MLGSQNKSPPHTGNNQQHPTQSIVLGTEGLVREKGGERWERPYVQKQTLPPAKWSRKHLQEGLGAVGFPRTVSAGMFCL